MTTLKIVPYQGTQLDLFPGDRITTDAGTATVKRVEQLGLERVFWADYGSGIAHPHQSEGILSSSPKQAHRRHSPKGHASGWLEERLGNKHRQTPSLSHYYHWKDPQGKHSRYIPTGKVEQVEQMIAARCAIADILNALGQQKGRSPANLHPPN
jgi:hypothetical protein